jgi:hypothetical protein
LTNLSQPGAIVGVGGIAGCVLGRAHPANAPSKLLSSIRLANACILFIMILCLSLEENVSLRLLLCRSKSKTSAAKKCSSGSMKLSLRRLDRSLIIGDEKILEKLLALNLERAKR